MTLGTTVTDQAAYTLASSLDNDAGERILELTVDGYEYEPGSAQIGRDLAQSNVYLRGNGIYWIDFTSAGVEQINLYPVPSEDDLDIIGLCVVEPTELSAGSDIPVVPSRFRYAIVDFAAAKLLGAREDNPELRAFHEQEFDRKVADLAILRTSRQGRKTVQMQVQGVHF